MTISSTKKSSAYTLLEILLAIGLGVLLTLVAVPAMAGWRSEHRMRAQAGALIALVQNTRLVAEKEGRRQVVVLASGRDGKGPGASTDGVHYFYPNSEYSWEFIRFDGAKDERPQPMIAIDSSGRVEPVSFRVRAGERFVEYRFDFLSGHAKEEGYSL